MAVLTNMLLKLISKWFNKPPYVRFYSLDSGALTLFPIANSSSLKRGFMIENQSGDNSKTLSSKNCPGIRKIVSSGWIVPAPADFKIQTNGDGFTVHWTEPFRFSKVTPNMDSYVATHAKSQSEPLIDDANTTLKTVVKIETPWRVEASDDVLLLIMPVTYNNENRFTAANGVFDPKYGHVLNIQLFWKVLEGHELIRAGTPLCQIIPISRKALNVSNYDVVIDEATELDKKKETEFNYASNCVFLSTDKISSRIKRVTSILNKYKMKG